MRPSTRMYTICLVLTLLSVLLVLMELWYILILTDNSPVALSYSVVLCFFVHIIPLVWYCDKYIIAKCIEQEEYI